ncbi:MAG: hypothetical protein MK226_01145 [Saprospiraceae bacterium]|nr:hypothetical protein [Saprospiraceae bacterium]
MKTRAANDRGPDCSCANKKTIKYNKNKGYPFLLTIVIAILPKCPFCMLAYSSAITMCSGATIYQHEAGVFSYISIILALVVVASIVMNRRDIRTWVATGLALYGTGLVVWSELYTGQLSTYMVGSSLLLLGALLNGNLLHFIQKGYDRKLQQKVNIEEKINS